MLKKDTVIRRLKRAYDVAEPKLQLKISKAIADKSQHGKLFVINPATGEVVKDNCTFKDLLIENNLLLDTEDFNE